MEGLTRWNAARSSAAFIGNNRLRSFNVQAQDKLHRLSTEILGEPIDPPFSPPAPYTGELFGIEYLYQEVGAASPALDEIDAEIDSGFDSDYTIEEASSSHFDDKEDKELNLACDAFAADPNAAHEKEDDVATDWRSIPGWEKVDALAAALIDSTDGLAVSQTDAEKIVGLYQQLSDFDKRPLIYERQLKPSGAGRFARSKEDTGGSHVGVDAMKRCFLSAGTPSLPPSKSRVVEAICTRLSITITSSDKNPHVSRCAKMIQRYNIIRTCVMDCPVIVDSTGIALFSINETTLTKWYTIFVLFTILIGLQFLIILLPDFRLQNAARRQEIAVLQQSIDLPPPILIAQEALPPPRQLETRQGQPTSGGHHNLSDPADATGQAKVRRPPHAASIEAVASSSSSLTPQDGSPSAIGRPEDAETGLGLPEETDAVRSK